MVNDPIGVITVGLDRLGFGIIDWFGSTTLAMVMVIIVSVWIWTPFVTVAVLAGLQSIPETLYEAAKVDGARLGTSAPPVEKCTGPPYISTGGSESPITSGKGIAT